MQDALQAKRRKLLTELFRDYAGPTFAIRLWNGWRWVSLAGERPAFTVVLETPSALSALIANPNEVTLGEAFLPREINIEGDIFSAFFVSEYLASRPRNLLERAKDLLVRKLSGADRWAHHGAEHSKNRDRAAISYHYDQPVEFFRPWLGSTLAYSCAYFRTLNDSLELAQAQKLELICQKLRLRPFERFLDIGCGWGSLILHAAQWHNVCAHGITLSGMQAEEAQNRIENAELKEKCAVELRDYRDCEQFSGSFDKIASVGMFEHVGLKNLLNYFHVVQKLLRPGGTFLNHGIARSASSPVRDNSFIERCVFPDCRLVTFSQVTNAAEAAGLEVRDVENLREHYELTLRRWVDGLRKNEKEVRKFVPETTYRTWLLYKAGSAAAFGRGDIGVYQVPFSRPNQGKCNLPLTREDWYATSNREHEIEV